MERYGLKPLARIVGYAQAEVAPKWLFLAPVEGVRQLSTGPSSPIEAFDLIEINEAFAAQTLADGRELGFDWSKVNVNGGAIALGHPIGASGARIVATLLHELARREGRYGLATLCLGGGGSVAMAFERVWMTRIWPRESSLAARPAAPCRRRSPRERRGVVAEEPRLDQLDELGPHVIERLIRSAGAVTSAAGTRSRRVTIADGRRALRSAVFEGVDEDEPTTGRRRRRPSGRPAGSRPRAQRSANLAH